MSSLHVPALSSVLILVSGSTVTLKWNNFAECCDLVALMKGAFLEMCTKAKDERHAFRL